MHRDVWISEQQYDCDAAKVDNGCKGPYLVVPIYLLCKVLNYREA